MNKIIVDTDLGSDPDDLIALLLLLRIGANIELLITGDEYDGKRATLAKRILDLEGRQDIPVIQGPDLGRKKFHVEELIEGYSYLFPTNPIELIEEVCKREEEVTYIGMQGFTNLANLLREKPYLKRKLKICQMGGALNFSHGEGWIEHNIKIDPESARYVLNSGANIFLLQSDTSANEVYHLSEDHPLYRRLKQSKDPTHQLVVRHCELFYEKKQRWSYMGDPLTVTAALGYDFVTFEEKRLRLNKQNKLEEAKSGKRMHISLPESRDRMFMAFLERTICKEEERKV